MIKDVFITDNRLTFTKILEKELKQQGYAVTLTSDTNTDNAIAWNKTSPFALQHIHIYLKNRNQALKTAIIIFDAIEYAKLYSSDSLIATDNTCTELISAYVNLTYILQTRILKQHDGRLIFVLRMNEDNSYTENTAVTVASSAFMRLAENTSLLLNSKKIAQVQSLLVKLDNPDESSAKWLVSQLDLSVLTRTVGKWVKAGQRGLFAK